MDSNGWTALHHACYKGDKASAEILIDSGANINAFSNSKKSPMHFAALNNHQECLELLIQRGADIEAQTDENCTPLHMAAKKGNLVCLQILLYAGANYYALDFRDWSALHYGSYNGKRSIVNYILKWDADYEKMRDFRTTQHKKAYEICKDPNTKLGFRILWRAAQLGDLDMIRVLHREGQELNEQTQHLRNTALHIAVLKQHTLVIRFLVENGADINMANAEGASPLDYVDKAENNFGGQDKEDAALKGEKIRKILLQSGQEPLQKVEEEKEDEEGE